MEWISQNAKFSTADKENFKFIEDCQWFEVRTIKITKPKDGKPGFEERTLRSEQEYRQWIEELSLLETPCPTLVLVMHLRLKDDGAEPTHLPYGKKTFRIACKKLFQHRTISHTLPRKSTVVFNHRSINWGTETPGQSIVYNCISDDESLHGNGNIILSTTCFTTIPLTYGVLYGCTTNVLDNIAPWLEECGESCFHPMILPMIFVELERKRLLRAAEVKGSDLHQRVLDMELRAKRQRKNNKRNEADPAVSTKGDSEIIHLLLSMNELKNGLEGLLIQLTSMRNHLGKPSEITLASGSEGGSNADICGVNIDLRLREIANELQSKLRSYEGLLGIMTLATQLEATDFTRTDSWVNFTIAKSSKRDSTQMRFISLMGMVFLPGTFLATLFSMTFFNWTPSTDNQVISPWVALYFGLTAITTGFTLLYWNRRNTHEESDSKEQFMQDLESAKDWMDSASLRRVDTVTQDSEDVILGAEPKVSGSSS